MGIAALESTRMHDELVGLIYEAAVDTDRWLEVARSLSAALDGRSITIWLRLPNGDNKSEFYRWPTVELDPEIFSRNWQSGLPWGSHLPDVGPASDTTRKFVQFDSVFPNDKLAETDYYKQWMAPQGLAAVSPVVHTFSSAGRVPTAAICIFQRIESAPFESAHFEFLDRLVPHLARAHCILDRLRAMRRWQEVVHEIIDRIPTGIVLIDETGHITALNDSAMLGIENHEGLRVEDGRLVVDDPDSDRWLQSVISEARDPRCRAEADPERVMVGHRSTTNGRIPLVVTRLMSPASESTHPDTVAMVFVGDSKLVAKTSVQLLRSLYGLTRAEAEIAKLLSDGLSLEEAAERRAVTLNTARSQLKRVFSKTGARRQADLVRIVIGGVASMRGARLAG